MLLRSLSELTLRQELLDVVKHDVMELNPHLYRDKFHKRSWRRLGEHRPMTTATAIVDWASAIMLGGLAEMTCSSRPYCYNEVYVVSIKGPLLSEGDANYQVYYNEVFSFLTEATGINKDNDHKAHEVHLAVVAKHVKDKYNCTELVIQSDQAPGYMNRCQAVNIGLSRKRWGIHVSHAFSEVRTIWGVGSGKFTLTHAQQSRIVGRVRPTPRTTSRKQARKDIKSRPTRPMIRPSPMRSTYSTS